MTYRFNGATSLQLGVFVLSLTLVHYNCLTFAMRETTGMVCASAACGNNMTKKWNHLAPYFLKAYCAFPRSMLAHKWCGADPELENFSPKFINREIREDQLNPIKQSLIAPTCINSALAKSLRRVEERTGFTILAAKITTKTFASGPWFLDESIPRTRWFAGDGMLQSQ